MNFKGYSKVKQDSKLAVFRHKSGHEIHVAIQKLSPKHQLALNSLPLENGDMVQTFAGGGHVEGPCKNPNCKSFGKVHPNCKCYNGMAKGGEVKSFCSGESMHQKGCEYFFDGGEVPPKLMEKYPYQTDEFDDMANVFRPDLAAQQSRFEQEQASMPKTLEEAKAQEQAAQQPQAPQSTAGASLADVPQTPAASAPQAPAAPQQSPDLTAGYEMQMQGMKDYADAIGDLGAAQAKIQNANAAAQQDELEHTQAIHAHIQGEMDSLAQDLKDHPIVAKGIFHDQSLDQKIGTTIGLILGGFGGGVAGTENPALKYINNQLEMDLKAQQANADKKNNLYSAYLKEYGNATDAANMTRMSMANIVLNKMQAAAANAQNPIAKAQLLQQMGPIQQNLDMMKAAVATDGAKGTAGGAGSGPDANYGPLIRAYKLRGQKDLAEDLESKWVPGVGKGEVPLPKETRDVIIAKNNLRERLQDLYAWSKEHSGSLSPSDIATGRTKAAELQSAYRNSINGGVFKKGEQEFIDTIIDSDPAKFFNSIRVLPKLKEVYESNNAQLNTLIKGYRIPPLQFPKLDSGAALTPQEQSYLNWAKNNPGDPRAQVVMKKLGNR